MNFNLFTKVDITKTNARRGDDPFKMKQQQNYLTVLQTIGLRVNPILPKDPFIMEHDTFGKCYCLPVSFEYAEAITKEMLISDFNLIPYIPDLNEFSNTDNNIFVTRGNNKNIIFEFW